MMEMFQARYWAFLFENLRRAVDDLYTSCEADGHIPGTKEVILVLENYVRDFRYFMLMVNSLICFGINSNPIFMAGIWWTG